MSMFTCSLGEGMSLVIGMGQECFMSGGWIGLVSGSSVMCTRVGCCGSCSLC